ncbi:MAG: glutamate racemase [Kiritimatiellae bacterium]|nr:glutamate racemase [Kiritimatiellia bacterium]
MTGFFDSGFGGLCILEAFMRECPGEPFVYIADNANCPYGNKSRAEIETIAGQIAEELIDRHQCRLIVVACNTATAQAIDFLRNKYPQVPFVGLEPAIKPAAQATKTGVVGVLATRGTFGGRLYRETSRKFAAGVTVLQRMADDWVELVERGVVDGPEAEAAVRTAVEPLLAAGADQLVLGCTHFPHLRPLIERVANGRAAVIDSCQAVARQARRLLECQPPKI